MRRCPGHRHRAPTPLTLDTEAITPSTSRLWLLPGQDYGIAEALADPSVVAELRAANSDDDSGAEGNPPPDPVAYDRAVCGADAERIDLTGADGVVVSVSVGGCFGQATETMFGVNATEYERAYFEMPRIDQVMTGVLADAEVVSEQEAWASCMAEAGYHPGDPTDLCAEMSTWVEDFLGGTATLDEVTGRERELAETDQGCRTSSGLGAAVSTTFVDLAEAEIESKQEVVIAYRQMVDHARQQITAVS